MILVAQKMFCDIQGYLFLYPFKKKKLQEYYLLTISSWSALRIHLHVQANAMVIPGNPKSVTFLSIFALSNGAMLNGSMSNGPRHRQTDIIMKVRPAHFWFLFPVLSQTANPHHPLKAFLVPSAFLSLLSIMGITHQNSYTFLKFPQCLRSGDPNDTKKWLLREKRNYWFRKR